ncbi:CpsD/CapB family tyrosine-protein kinase [Priestia megaterium]|uniref:CpsD/CapB family tyrosine-protein kinase n=1 Tax=Priestia megaterium TaxID=1404 RepID=UPI003000B267
MEILNRKEKNIKKSSLNLIAHNDPNSSISEQYRMIRTNIEFASVDKKVQSIVVTSAVPSDGKSTTASNLAIVLAQTGKRVLLVDADLRKPSIHYAFNLSNTQGLTNVLVNRITLKNAISHIDIPNLSVLTSGPVPPSPSELLSSKKMKLIIEELNQTFDYIIFDTPPVLAVTDPQVLSEQCDAILMVVKSGETPKEAALKAKALLQKSKTPILGMILNNMRFKTSKYNYLYK